MPRLLTPVPASNPLGSPGDDPDGDGGASPVSGPDPVDIHVGHRVRLRRNLMGLSQDGLAAAIGVSFRQVQKYEQGANRVSASRLYDMARALRVPVSYFFDDLDPTIDQDRPGSAPEPTGEMPRYENDHMSRTETLRLLRAYWGLPSNDMRQRVMDLLEALRPSLRD